MEPYPREGILAAIVTPTDARGRLLERSLRQHVAWLRDQGVHGLVALGSTGEFPRFSVAERKKILRVIASAAGDLPVIANISDLRADAAIELGTFARKLGLCGVALLPPAYYPLSDADQLAFFLGVARAVRLPVLLYNFPEVTGNRVSIGTMSAFADRERMIGVKQSGAEFGYHRAILALARKKSFAVFSGADTRLPEAFALGASGCVGGLVNFVPEPMLEVYHAFRSGHPKAGSAAAARLRSVGEAIDRVTFPLNVAAGLAARGLDPGAPKTIVSRETQRLYRTVVKDLQGLFRTWNLPSAAPR